MLGRDPGACVLHRHQNAALGGTRREADGRSGWRVAHRVCRQVLQRLLEPIAVADDGFGPGRDRVGHRHLRGLAGALVTCRHAGEELRYRHVAEGHRSPATLEPRQIEQIADDPFEPRGFVADDRQIARPRPLVERDLGHGQRFEISTHRRHRRRQLVGDVGEQLTPRAVGRRQGIGAAAEVAGHRVEGGGDGRDLVAAAIGSPRRQVARSESARGLFEVPQAAPRRAENDHRREHGSHDEDASGDERERRRESCQKKTKRRARRHDHHRRQTITDDYGRRPREAGGIAFPAARPLGLRPLDALEPQPRQTD